MHHTGRMTESGRDRLRELLDAVLDESHTTLSDMADGAHSSPFHFNRRLRRDAGEPPVAMRRRVMLERAAWRIARGSTVTDAAFEAGYESVEGFARAYARAFGHPPSTPAAGHWLPAPNGIHFHPPMSLWVQSTEQAMNPLTEHLVRHDLDDTRELLDLAKGVGEEAYESPALPGLQMLGFDGPDESLAQVLEHLVHTKEVWLAAIDGADLPAGGARDPAGLLARLDDVGPRWLARVRDLDARGGVGGPPRRRPVRPARELRDGQRVHARGDLRGRAAPGRTAPAAPARGGGGGRGPDHLAAPPARRGVTRALRTRSARGTPAASPRRGR